MAWEHSVLDKEVAARWTRLGHLGEFLAIKLLKKAGFSEIRNLNEEQKNKCYADIYAKRDTKAYVISVKTRNKYENNGTLNSRYKLGANCYTKSETAEKDLNSEAAWIAIAIDVNTGTFDAYFGTLKSLNGNTGELMTARATSKYERLAWKEKLEDHGIEKSIYKDLKNIYRRRK